ncbi:MAG: hypothetical protein IJP34_01655 [Clostridia bacterium]|nr:hypothetical protein [Clostridia bacterium]
MGIFDFAINTQDAKIEDFNKAVDCLKYMEQRNKRDNDSYYFEEYEQWIKAIYIFIERCIDFYPPSKNFDFLYRDFNIKEGIKRYLRIYILMEYMRKKECLLFAYSYFENEITDMEKDLTDFVNTSNFIREFIISYNRVVDFDMEEYKEFGKLFKINDFVSDYFPFVKADFSYSIGINESGEECFEVINFYTFEYIVFRGQLLKLNLSDFYSNEEKIQDYFKQHSEYKEKFDALIKEILNNRIKKEELYSKFSNVWNRRKEYVLQAIKKYEDPLAPLILKSENKDLDVLKEYVSEKEKLELSISQCSFEIDSINREIQELSCLNKVRMFLLSLPDFIPYKNI